MEIERKEIKIPTNCPTCNSVLELVNDQLFCKNINCESKTSKQVEKFAKVMKIKGLGPATINKLNISTIPEIYSLTEKEIVDAIGEKLGKKLFIEIVNSLNTEIENVLSAFSIPLIGIGKARAIATEVKTISEISEESCIKANIGEKATNNLLNWINTEYINEYSSIPFNFTISDKPISPVNSIGETVCISGKLEGYSRSEAKKKLESLGYKVVDSISKNVKYLICEEDSSSSKVKKANQLNIPIIKLSNILGEN